MGGNSAGRARPRRRVLRPAPDRFIGPAIVPELLPGAWLTPRPPNRDPDVVVDLRRADDLVALSVEAYGLQLVSGSEPVLQAGSEDGTLVVRLAFQHATERAIYEAPVTGIDEPETDPDPTEGAAARHAPPEQARAAHPSRLVFQVPAGTQIPFSSDGILAALSTLEMAVHPRATPRPRAIIPQLAGQLGTGVLSLGGNLVAVPTASGLVVATANARRPAVDPSTTRGLTQLMRDRRVARAITARLGAVSSVTEPPPRARGAAPAVRVGGRTFTIGRFTEPGLVPGGSVLVPRPRARLSREPQPLETAIEAPYRLVISPSSHGGWSHATEPERAEGAEHRVELWHTRLGVRQTVGDDVVVNETSTYQRIIRAIWARDRELDSGWNDEPPATLSIRHENVPFRMSLDPADRHMLVRQSAETWLGQGNARIEPDPVDVRRLYLSSIGAWLDLFGGWETMPYSTAGLPSIESWDHVAPMGRDQFVKVVYPGYLWPFGHRCSLVKLTERKMKDASPSVAGLFQRKFLVIREPVRRFGERNLPITETRVAPLVSPTLDDPANQEHFVPLVGGQPFEFVLHTRDQEDRPGRLVTPLVWVAEHFVDAAAIRGDWTPHARVPADGQKVAYAPVAKGGDTVAKTQTLTFDAEPFVGGSTPRMVSADVTIDAVQQLSDLGAVKVGYHQRYLDHGFGAQNAGEVWAELVRETGGDPLTVQSDTPKVLGFGGSSPSGSDKAGGFLQPNQSVGGLSRKQGTVNDLDNVATGQFDPAAFLGNALPKLFGVVELVDLLDAVGVGLDDAPGLVSETLDRIESFMDELERAKTIAAEAVADGQRLVSRAASKAAEQQQAAQDALNAAQALQTQVVDAVDAVLGALTSLVDATTQQAETALTVPLDALRTAIAQMRTVAPVLPPMVRSRLLRLADVLTAVVDAADLIDDIVRFVNGLGSSSAQFSYRYEWRPRLQSWPSSDPILVVQPDSLMLGVEGRIDGKGAMGVDALAELRDFELRLMPGEELVRFKFDHLSFKAGTAGKAEVDVVLGEIEFVGLLGFVETIKELIPFDGFSDPPHLDVTAEGLTAGFSIDLPNLAVGVFSLSNLSLGADVRVPFLGESVSVGFYFCRRERPFVLAVTFIGGGGFFGLRLGPDKLQVLELSLEAGATLSVDFGVASGSISAMVGVYMRLEGDAGSLTGYFRLRGEVDVLGLISASIELYLELYYEFPTGKMIGTATLTIKVEVLIFSGSVTIKAERRFKGSNGDPTFVDIMGLEADGSSPAWSDYCRAFAGA